MPRPSSALSRDRSVIDHRLAPGTMRRILGFARPYRSQISGFLALVVLASLLGAASPLLLKAIIDNGAVAG